MAILDLDGTEQPIDPMLVMAIEAAFRRVSTTSVQFVSTPRSWKESAPGGKAGGPTGTAKQSLRFRIAQRDGADCAYCAQTFIDLDQATLDHVIPREIVKHWQPWNLVLACEACNTLKDNRVPAVMMPLLCHLLRSLLPLVPQVRAAEEARRESNRLDLRRRKAAKRLSQSRERARQQRAQFNKAIVAMTGKNARLAIEAPTPHAALLPSGGGTR